MKSLEGLKARWVAWVWSHTPNCAEMSRLGSRSMDRPVTLNVRLRMWLHYLICVWCERYSRHLKFLHRAAPQSQERLETVANGRLSEQSKRRMAERLRGESRS